MGLHLHYRRLSVPLSIPPPPPSPSPFSSSSAAATARRSARRSYRTAAVRGDQRFATEPLRRFYRLRQTEPPSHPPTPPHCHQHPLDSTAPSSSVTWRHTTAALPSSRNLTDPKKVGWLGESRASFTCTADAALSSFHFSSLHSSIPVLTWSSWVSLMQGADRREARPHGISIPKAAAAFRL